MCWEKMKLLLLNPTSAIAKSKNPKEIKTTIEILLIAWAIIGLSILIGAPNLSMQLRIGGALLIFALGTAATAFYAFLLQLVTVTLGGKGKYYHALTALTYGKFPIAVGLLLVSILSPLGVLGSFLALIATLVLVLIGISAVVGAVKEFFGVEVITAWIALGILVLGTIIAIYLTMGSSGSIYGQSMMSTMRFGMWAY